MKKFLYHIEESRVSYLPTDVLRKFGQQGWELVAVTHSKSITARWYFYFKREL